ncbi:hypothetical protein G9A89_020600 [Geosiphon pyriformis]|nr:hypothetical protein G9A89_020600 [Geosiphon pyriformis]
MSKSSRLNLLADNTLVTVLERNRCKNENIDHVSHEITISKNLQKLKSGINELEQELSLAEQSGSLNSNELKQKEDTLIKITKQVEKLEALMGESNDISARQLILGLSTTVESSSTESKKKRVRFTDPVTELNVIDDHQVLQLQQQIMNDQDEDLDRLDESIGRQRELGILIGDELNYHIELLEETENAVDSTDSRLASARRRLNRVSKQAKEKSSFWIILDFRDHQKAFSSVNWIILNTVNEKSSNLTNSGSERTPAYIQYFVKAIFAQDRYFCLITDLRYVWFEELVGDEIIQRCQETESGLDIQDLATVLTSLSGFLKSVLNIKHVVRRKNDDLTLHSTRYLSWGELYWKFQCRLIPIKGIFDDGDEEDYLDGASILYNHFILPNRILVAAFSEQIKVLNNKLEESEEELKESTRQIEFLKAQKNDGKAEKSLNSKKKKQPQFNTFTEIERRIQNLDILKGGDISDELYVSTLFVKATQRVVEEVVTHQQINRKISLKSEIVHPPLKTDNEPSNFGEESSFVDNISENHKESLNMLPTLPENNASSHADYSLPNSTSPIYNSTTSSEKPTIQLLEENATAAKTSEKERRQFLENIKEGPSKKRRKKKL